MAKHVILDRCDDQFCVGCNICNLAVCKICSLYEGSLTTDCPGEEAFAEYNDAIYAGEIDYREGEGWVKKLNPTNYEWLRHEAYNRAKNRNPGILPEHLSESEKNLCFNLALNAFRRRGKSVDYIPKRLVVKEGKS